MAEQKLTSRHHCGKYGPVECRSLPNQTEDGMFQFEELARLRNKKRFITQNAAALQHFREPRQARQRVRDFIGRSTILASDREPVSQTSEMVAR